MKKYLILFFGFTSMFLSSCTSDVKTKLVATITEVRISTSNSFIEGPKSDPVSGAIVGAAIYGKIGAVVGAELANNQDPKVVHVEITNCQIIAKTEDGTNLRWFFDGNNARIVSTFKSGDRISITKTVEETGRILYYWNEMLEHAEIIP